MRTFSASDVDDRSRLESAAAWHLRLRADPSLELSSAYLDWMANAENARAFRAVREGWATVGDLGATPQILEWRQAALRRARRAGAGQWLPLGIVTRLAAAFAVAAIVGAGTLYYTLWKPSTYETALGERRVVALSDGSRISLDSDTELQVRYSKSGRTVWLERGRTRFDVAPDVGRPFTVAAGFETVIAVGTSFSVERLGQKVLVTLIQGHVIVKSAVPAGESQAEKPAVSLNPGEELIASRETTPAVVQASLQAATAWEAGHLIFKDETLGEAVARVNRYTEHPITVDPSVASLRISGVFNAGDVTSFVSAVTSYFSIQATTTPNNTVLLQRRS